MWQPGCFPGEVSYELWTNNWRALGKDLVREMNALVGTTQREDKGCSSSSSAEGIGGHSEE